MAHELKKLNRKLQLALEEHGFSKVSDLTWDMYENIRDQAAAARQAADKARRGSNDK